MSLANGSEGPQLPSFLTLPTELILHISAELSTPAVRGLRSTCKRLADALQAEALRDMTINVSQLELDRDMDKLRMLAHGRSAAVHGTRNLKILSLAPSYDPNYIGSVWKHVDDQWVADPEPDFRPAVYVAEKEMRKYVYDAISSLRGVRAIKWNPGPKDEEDVHESVMAAILTLPNLEHFHVTLSYLKITLPFHHLPPLRTLSFSGSNPKNETQDIFDDVSALVAKSPNLSSLSAYGSYRYGTGYDPMQALHRLLQYRPAGPTKQGQGQEEEDMDGSMEGIKPLRKPLNLRSLVLEDVLVRLDHITLPHLRNLTSLTLRNIKDPYETHTSAWSAIGPPSAVTPDLAPSIQAHSSPLADLWVALGSAQIHLMHITIDRVSPAFLGYLESYSGLHTLHAYTTGFRSQEPSDALAGRFWDCSLAKHTESIRELDVTPPYEGRWCFVGLHLNVLRRCKGLKKLRLGVISSQLWNVDQGGDAMTTLLNEIAFNMTSLELLHISPASPESLRHARCGNGHRSHLNKTNGRIFEIIGHYRAPKRTTRMPWLRVGSGMVWRPVPEDTFDPTATLKVDGRGKKPDYGNSKGDRESGKRHSRSASLGFQGVNQLLQKLKGVGGDVGELLATAVGAVGTAASLSSGSSSSASAAGSGLLGPVPRFVYQLEESGDDQRKRNASFWDKSDQW